MSLFALVLLLAAAPVAAPRAGGAVVERVVAVVRNPASAPPRPLTLTRLDEEARIALVSQGATLAAFAPLDAAARKAALRWLLDQWLVAEEAVRLKVDEVPRVEVQEALQGFRRRFQDEATYRRFLASTELTEEELRSILARGVRAERFLKSRLGRGTQVSDDEASRWLAGQGLVAPGEEARRAAKAKLSDERTQRLTAQLLADLRARADVRVLMPELREGPAR